VSHFQLRDFPKCRVQVDIYKFLTSRDLILKLKTCMCQYYYGLKSCVLVMFIYGVNLLPYSEYPGFIL